MLDAISPLEAAFTDVSRFRLLMVEVGLTDTLVGLQDDVLAAEPLRSIATDLGAILGDARALRSTLKTDSEASDPKLVRAVQALTLDGFRLLRRLGWVQRSDLSMQLPPALQDPAWWAELALVLPEYLLLRELEASTPILHAVLILLGVIELSPSEPPARGPRQRLVWKQLVALLTDPVHAIDKTYAWTAGPFDFERMLGGLRALGEACGIETLVDEDGGLRVPMYTHVGKVALARVSAVAAPLASGRGFSLGLSALGSVSRTVPLGEVLALVVSAEVEAGRPLALELSPGSVAVVADAPSGQFAARVQARPAKPRVLVGQPERSRVELLGCAAGLAMKLSDAGSELQLMADLGEAGTPGLRVIVALGGADSFLSTSLGGEIRSEFGLSLIWSSRTGFVFGGVLALEAVIPLCARWGPLTLETLRLRLAAETATQGLQALSALDLTLELGPFAATVQDIGVRFVAVPEAGGDGPLDGLTADLAFKPPKGIGLAIDSEAVKGGGFLSLDVEAGRYAGVLELVTPSFGLTALGILNTKIPGEPKGWSLFFALTATFSPPLQLGFGFVLSGVGGLFAVNRRLDEPAMREAVRGGNLDSVLFPTDVVKEAPRIFATVESMFPIAKGSFVFGPMIKVGWGTPPLVEAMIGVFVSLPRPLIIALLGRVRCALPTPEKPILILNMDIAGSINFGAGTVGLDAQIHDSSLFGLELTGAMAFRARFKDQPGFLLSVGGFHPAFVPPADVGKLTRMGMSLRFGKQENILVTLSSYFALTSNTLQFGAAIEVSASVSVFKVAGGAYFDALIVYKPFHFTAGMGAYFSVSWGERDLLAVRVALVLDGPGPWRARGEASFTIAKFEKSFRFDETFGDKIAASSERAPVAAPLRAALAQPRNWGAQPGGFTSLRLRDLSANDAGPIVVAPDARVGFRQRVAPLGLKLEQMGPAEPQEPGPFEVQVLAVAAQKPAALSKLTELFAPAAFLDLSDEEKLTAPSFEPMKAGVAFGDRWTAPEEKHRYTVAEDSDERYEQKGELWPKARPPSVEVIAFAQRVRRPGEAWKLKRAAVTVAPAGYVRAGGEGVPEVDAPAVAWHEARAVRSAGERVVPVYAVKKVGR